MSEPSEEAAWTAKYVRDMAETRGYIVAEKGFEAVAEAHNAGIAKLREENEALRNDAYAMQQENERLFKLLSPPSEAG